MSNFCQAKNVDYASSFEKIIEMESLPGRYGTTLYHITCKVIKYRYLPILLIIDPFICLHVSFYLKTCRPHCVITSSPSIFIGSSGDTLTPTPDQKNKCVSQQPLDTTGLFDTIQKSRVFK